MPGEAVHHHGGKLRLDQRADIVNQFFGYVHAVFRDPVSWNFLGLIGTLEDVLSSGNAEIGILGNSL